jgi:hypothetical protein
MVTEELLTLVDKILALLSEPAREEVLLNWDPLRPAGPCTLRLLWRLTANADCTPRIMMIACFPSLYTAARTGHSFFCWALGDERGVSDRLLDNWYSCSPLYGGYLERLL